MTLCDLHYLLYIKHLTRLNKVMTDQVKSVKTQKSGQEVAKLSGVSYGKTDTRYWDKRLYRATYSKGGSKFEVKDWYVRMSFKGRREIFNLGTANKASASRQARDIYLSLQAEGWIETVAKYKGKSLEDAKKVNCTVGDFLEGIRSTSELKPKTFADYAKSFRQIVAQIKGVKSDKDKFNPHTGGRDKWLAKVDSVKLESITPAKVQRWKLQFLKEHGSNAERQRSAKNNVNSIMRQAKTLFSPKHTRFLPLEMPSPLPFEGVEFFPRQSMRYQSSIDVEQLVQDAASELGEGKADKQEQFKVFVLAVMAGLRRNEIDALEWSAFDFDNGVLRIQATEFFQPKSEDSLGEVDLDEEIVSVFRGFRAKASGAFVIESKTPPRVGISYTSYRCEKIHKALIAWLRAKGVTARKPIHELRKEFGSLIANSDGIWAASRALRHADISITSQHYLDKKKRVSSGLGKLLAKGKNPTVAFEPEKEADASAKEVSL